MDTLKGLRQGKYFEIEINENNENKAKSKIEDMCNKLLVNLITEDFEISKI
jgi:phosphoribosylformylglycinamidine synthase PurS subunit